MDSTVPPGRLILVPKGNTISFPRSSDVLFEKASYAVYSKDSAIDADFAVMSMACLENDTPHKPESFNTYVKKCADILQGAKNGADYIMVYGGGYFLQTRAAIVAAREHSKSKMVFVLLQVDEHKNTADGWDVLGQVITLEGMEDVGIILDCVSPTLAEELLEQILPYVGTMPIGVWVEDESFVTRAVVDGADIIVCKKEKAQDFVKTVKSMGFLDTPSKKPAKKDDIVAVSNGYPTIVQTYVDISDAIVCDDDFADNILLSEDDAWAVTKVDICDENALDIFETEQYMLTEPLCIYSEDVEIFSRAVKMFCGRAIYDGTCDIPDDVLSDLHKKYGLIIL